MLLASSATYGSLANTMEIIRFRSMHDQLTDLKTFQTYIIKKSECIFIAELQYLGSNRKNFSFGS